MKKILLAIVIVAATLPLLAGCKGATNQLASAPASPAAAEPVAPSAPKTSAKPCADNSCPGATTVFSAIHNALVYYCSEVPTATTDVIIEGGHVYLLSPSPIKEVWWAGSTTVQGEEMQFKVTLPKTDGTPGTVSAGNSLAKEAFASWKCAEPMYVISGQGSVGDGL